GGRGGGEEGHGTGGGVARVHVLLQPPGHDPVEVGVVEGVGGGDRGAVDGEEEQRTPGAGATLGRPVIHPYHQQLRVHPSARGREVVRGEPGEGRRRGVRIEGRQGAIPGEPPGLCPTP